MKKNRKLSISIDSTGKALDILETLKKENVDIELFNVSRPTLDEVFIKLTGKVTQTNPEEEKDKNGLPLQTAAFKQPILNPGRGIKNYSSNAITQNLMFAWRGIVKIKHIPEQFLDVLITPIMFTFMFTFLFGGAVEGSPADYLYFLLPGILVQTIVFNSMYAGINIHTDVTKGIHDRFRSMSVGTMAPITGIFISDFWRYLLSGLVVLGFSLILGFRSSINILDLSLAFMVMIAFAMALSWLFIIVGLALRNVSAVYSVSWLLLSPLVFMSNIFVDVSTMPQWLQAAVQYNPVVWQVDAVRALFHGEAATTLIVKALAISLLITIILAPVGAMLFRKER